MIVARHFEIDRSTTSVTISCDGKIFIDQRCSIAAQVL